MPTVGAALTSLGAIFWVAMLAYCILRDPEERHIWIWVIVFLNVVGAAIYFFVRVLPRLGLYDRLIARRRRAREIERIEGDLVHFDRPHLWAQLGRLKLEQRDLAGAEAALRRAVAGGDDVDYVFDLARVEFGSGRTEAAAVRLAEVVRRDPDHGYGDAKRLLARALVDLGRDGEARPLLAELVRTRPSAEVRYHMAVLLERAGDAAGARAEVERIELEKKAAPPFARRRDEVWRRKARALAKRLGGRAG
jgi:hypothetical protein